MPNLIPKVEYENGDETNSGRARKRHPRASASIANTKNAELHQDGNALDSQTGSQEYIENLIQSKNKSASKDPNPTFHATSETEGLLAAQVEVGNGGSPPRKIRRLDDAEEVTGQAERDGTYPWDVLNGGAEISPSFSLRLLGQLAKELEDAEGFRIEVTRLKEVIKNLELELERYRTELLETRMRSFEYRRGAKEREVVIEQLEAELARLDPSGSAAMAGVMQSQFSNCPSSPGPIGGYTASTDLDEEEEGDYAQQSFDRYGLKAQDDAICSGLIE